MTLIVDLTPLFLDLAADGSFVKSRKDFSSIREWIDFAQNQLNQIVVTHPVHAVQSGLGTKFVAEVKSLDDADGLIERLYGGMSPIRKRMLVSTSLDV